MQTTEPWGLLYPQYKERKVLLGHYLHEGERGQELFNLVPGQAQSHVLSVFLPFFFFFTAQEGTQG